MTKKKLQKEGNCDILTDENFLKPEEAD